MKRARSLAREGADRDLGRRQGRPGAYGLNRNVTLTILVGKDNRVTANFALVQPSLQADVPKVLGEVVKLIGGKVPPSISSPHPARPRDA